MDQDFFFCGEGRIGLVHDTDNILVLRISVSSNIFVSMR